MVAGAPVKHAPVSVLEEFVCQGVWRETRSDGSVWMVADLTSALWRYREAEPKKAKRR